MTREEKTELYVEAIWLMYFVLHMRGVKNARGRVTPLLPPRKLARTKLKLNKMELAEFRERIKQFNRNSLLVKCVAALKTKKGLKKSGGA